MKYIIITMSILFYSCAEKTNKNRKALTEKTPITNNIYLQLEENQEDFIVDLAEYTQNAEGKEFYLKDNNLNNVFLDKSLLKIKGKVEDQKIAYGVKGATVDSNISHVFISYENKKDKELKKEIVIKEDTSTVIEIKMNEGWSIYENPLNGYLSEGDSLVYTPKLNFVGIDNFTLFKEDDKKQMNIISYDIIVEAINDPPEIQNQSYFFEKEQLINGSLNFLDVDSDELDISLVNLPRGSLNLDSQTGLFQYSSNLAEDDFFTVSVSDGKESALATISLKSLSSESNSELSSTNQIFNVLEDSILNSNLQGVGENINFILVNSTSNGSLNLNSNGSFNYTPNNNFFGTDVFSFKITNGVKTSSLYTATINVENVNDPPNAFNFTYNINDNESLTDNFQYQDIDSNTFFATILNEPNKGTVTLNGLAFTYTPSEAGVDSFTYQLSDGSSVSSIATISFNITETNQNGNLNQLVLDDLNFEMDEDTVLSSNLNTDFQSQPIIKVNPTYGIVNLSNNMFTYTPENNFNGNDFFILTFQENNKEYDLKINLKVNPINDVPKLNNESLLFSTVENVSINKQLLFEDVEADPVTFNLVEDAKNGLLTLNSNGSFIYNPNVNFYGQDSFLIRLKDSEISPVYTVLIDVESDNKFDEKDFIYQFNEDQSFSNQLNIPNKDLSSLTFSLNNDVQSGNLILENNGFFTYTPNPNFNGQDQFSFTVSDTLEEFEYTVQLNVNPVNDAPSLNSDVFEVLEDQVLNDKIQGQDIDSDTFNIEVLVNPNNGQLSLSGDGMFTYTPNPNFKGQDQFQASITDSEGLVRNQIYTITVLPVNDYPISSNQSFSVLEDQIYNGTLNVSDLENDLISVSLVNNVSSGNLTINNDGTFTYTPNPNFNGQDQFSFTVSDTTGSNNQVYTASIITNEVNDAPTSQNYTFNLSEDQSFSGLLEGTDIDNSTLNFSLSQNSSKMILNTDGTFTYTPDANFNGSDDFQFTVSDGIDESSEYTVTFNVNPINDNPLLNNNRFTTLEDQVLQESLIFQDVDNDIITTSIKRQSVNGNVELFENGNFTYTPNADFNGEDTFEVIFSDGSVSLEETVYISVTPVDDPPTTNYSFSLKEDEVLIETIDAVDKDGDTLTYISSSENLIFNENQFTYTPNPNTNGNQVVDVTISDGLNNVNAKFYFNVEAVNDIPTITTTSFSVLEDNILNSQINIMDIDSTPTLSLIETTANGTFVLNGNQFTYQPNTNFNGQDSFKIQIEDQEFSEVFSFNIEVLPQEDKVSFQTNFSTLEDTLLESSLNIVDPENNALIEFHTDVSNGSLTFSSPNFIYTPNQNFNGNDTFSVKVTENGEVSYKTITINVEPVNDIAVLNQLSYQINEDNTLNQSWDITDPESNYVISLIRTSQSGALSVTNNDFTYVPDTNFNGNDSFDIQIKDGVNETNYTIVIEVLSDYDPFTFKITQPSQEETYNGSFDLIWEYNTIDEDINVDVVATTESCETVLYSNNIISLSKDLNIFQYTFNNSMEQNFHLCHKVSDSQTTEYFQSFTFIVPPSNYKPEVENQTINIVDDITDFKVNATDPDGDLLTYQIIEQPSYGTVSGEFPNLIYTKPNEISPSNGTLEDDRIFLELTSQSINGNQFEYRFKLNNKNYNEAINDWYLEFDSNFTIDEVIDANGLNTGSNSYRISAPSWDTIIYSEHYYTIRGTLNSGETEPLFSYKSFVSPEYNTEYESSQFGEFTFKYLANDGEFNSDVATVTFSIEPPPKKIWDGLVGLYYFDQSNIIKDYSKIYPLTNLVKSSDDTVVNNSLLKDSNLPILSTHVTNKIVDNINNSQEFSLEIVYTPNDVVTSGYLFAMGNDMGGFNFVVKQEYTDLVVLTNSNNGINSFRFNDVLTLDKNFLQLSYGNTMKLYKNGELLSEKNISNLGLNWLNYRISLGGNYSKDYIRGSFDMISIYKKELNDYEFISNFKFGSQKNSIERGHTSCNNSNISRYNDLGQGNQNNPYILCNVSQIDHLARNNCRGCNNHFVLGQDIDLSSFNNLIGNSANPFNASFDGKGFILSNLNISLNDREVGLFRSTGTNTLIKNISLENITVSGEDETGSLIGESYSEIDNIIGVGINVSSSRNEVGGLVGENNNGNISNIILESQINAQRDRIGGLVGYHRNGLISKVLLDTDINGDDKVGGLVGENQSNINQVYVSYLINGDREVGGLVGENEGDIQNSFSKGTCSSGCNSLIGNNKSSSQNLYWESNTESDTNGQQVIDLFTNLSFFNFLSEE